MVLSGTAEANISLLAFSRCGRRLLTASTVPDQRVSVWDWEKQALMSTLHLPFRAAVVSFSPFTADTVCIVGVGGQLRLLGGHLRLR